MNLRLAACLAVLTTCALGCGRDSAPPPEPPKPPTTTGARPQGVSWGAAAGGLQAGLSASQGVLEAGTPMEIALHLRASGDKELKLFGFTSFPEGRYCHFATLTFTSRDSSTKAKLVCGVFTGPVGIETLRKGQDLTVKWLLDSGVDWHFLDAQGKRIDRLPPGVYRATVEYACTGQEEAFPKGCWTGMVTSGTVDVEIAGPGQAKERKP